MTTIQGSNVAGVTSAKATLKIGASDITIKGGDIPRVLQGTWTSHGTPTFTQSVEGGAYTAEFTQSSAGGIFIFGPRKESLDLTLAVGTGGAAGTGSPPRGCRGTCASIRAPRRARST